MGILGDQWRNNSRKNEGMEPKQKEYSAVDVTGSHSFVFPQGLNSELEWVRVTCSENKTTENTNLGTSGMSKSV